MNDIIIISIHAPLRGRQQPPTADDKQAFISIHAPLRGRPLSSVTRPIITYFNPRPLAGATGGFFALPEHIIISIHAPLRGRQERGNVGRHQPGFQSTPPCGGDCTNRLFPIDN